MKGEFELRVKAVTAPPRGLDADLAMIWTFLLILAYEGERLVGIAPCHARDVVHRPGLRARRLELTGNLWRTPSAVMSERTGFIVDCDHPGVWDALSAAVIDQQDWGDFVLSLSRTDGETFGSLRRMGSAAGFFVRDADPMSAYHIDLSGGFDAWLGRLGQGVRRQVFNKRSKLETAGGLRWETANASDANAFYEDLDRLHREDSNVSKTLCRSHKPSVLLRPDRSAFGI